MSEALNSCPFCGASDKARMSAPTCNKRTPYNPADRAFPVVRCACGAEVAGDDWDQSGRSAVAKWNRRAVVPQDPAQAALCELVELKDLKQRVEGWGGGSTDELAELSEEYGRRKPLAWAFARQVLAGQPGPRYLWPDMIEAEQKALQVTGGVLACGGLVSNEPESLETSEAEAREPHPCASGCRYALNGEGLAPQCFVGCRKAAKEKIKP